MIHHFQRERDIVFSNRAAPVSDEQYQQQPFFIQIVDYVFLQSFMTIADIHAIQVMCRATYVSCQSSEQLWEQLAHMYAPLGFWELADQRIPDLAQPCLRWYDELHRLVAFQSVAKWSLKQFIDFWLAQEHAYEHYERRPNVRKGLPVDDLM